MKGRWYAGRRTLGGAKVLRVAHGMQTPLRGCQEIWNHSPTGFEWGYGGSGPAQLALALLMDALADQDRAIELHQAYKWEVVAKLPAEGWEITQEEITAWAMAHDQELADLDWMKQVQDEQQAAIDAGDVLDLAKQEGQP